MTRITCLSQNLFIPALAATLLFSCKDDGGGRVTPSSDSIAVAAKIDSLKKQNPLLIVPPDSQYTGSYIDRYPNGVVKYTGFFRFGERHGQWMSFYPDGSQWSEMHYDKGLRHGPNVAYFENGRKRYEGIYLNDKRDSIWNYFDTSGRLAERVLFREDRIVNRLPADEKRRK